MDGGKLPRGTVTQILRFSSTTEIKNLVYWNGLILFVLNSDPTANFLMINLLTASNSFISIF